jgi:hypothetical protein
MVVVIMANNSAATLRFVRRVDRLVLNRVGTLVNRN